MKLIECQCGQPLNWGGNTEEQTLGWSVLQDEAGRAHVHDPNLRRAAMRCDGCGAKYVLAWYPHCWCGWAKGTPEDALRRVFDRVTLETGAPLVNPRVDLTRTP